MLENNRTAAAISESFVFAIALATGSYSGAAGSSEKNFGSVLRNGSFLASLITLRGLLTYLIVAILIIDEITDHYYGFALSRSRFAPVCAERVASRLLD